MEIKDLGNLPLPKKIEKSTHDKIQLKKVQNKTSTQTKNISEGDQVEISDKAKELQESGDEIKVARELLTKLPSARAHVIFEALAKLKAGLYSSDQIMQEAASKLLQNGELDDLK
ncbi:MAG: hypothetical protein ACE5HO_11765 [bacterium]